MIEPTSAAEVRYLRALKELEDAENDLPPSEFAHLENAGLILPCIEGPTIITKDGLAYLTQITPGLQYGHILTEERQDELLNEMLEDMPDE